MGDFRVVAFKISLLVPGFRNTWLGVKTRYLLLIYLVCKKRAISWFINLLCACERLKLFRTENVERDRSASSQHTNTIHRHWRSTRDENKGCEVWFSSPRSDDAESALCFWGPWNTRFFS